MATRVLVVDDDRGLLETMKIILDAAGYDCAVAQSGDDGIQLVQSFKPDLIISDVVMPGMNGIELVSTLRNTHPHVPIILLSGTARTQELLAEAGEGVEGVVVLAKPFPPRELLRMVAQVARTSAA